MERLSEKEILIQLQNLNGWTLNEGALEKPYLFKDFKEALAFINEVGILAEEVNHHPEIFNVYHKVRLRLSTHDANGITIKDIDLAEKISTLQ
jgi:4a-hydroxytetrahydrobiopterin dehydratase